jgi:LysM repeat protein
VAGPVKVADNSGYYTVRRGDNLWTISRAFQVSIPAIRSHNGLRSDNLRIGQRIRIPGQGLQTQSSQPTIGPSASSQRVSIPEGGISYRVKRGDNLTAIAQRHGVSIEQIRSANSLRSDNIQVGQTIRIPGVGGQLQQMASSEPKVHVVRRGENLWMISKRYGVTIDELRAANRMRGDQVRIGQKLSIPSEQQAGGSYLAPSRKTVHVVRRGENLWMISQKYGASIQQIKRVNNLSESRIIPGKRLLIPSSSS